MRWFTTSARPARPGAARRTRLGLERLDDRAVPSSLNGGDPPPFLDPSPPTDPLLIAPPPLQTAPRIVGFLGAEMAHGYYQLSGRVDAGMASGGQTVTFAGLPGLEGQSTVTLSDGTFSVLVRVATDGSDHGTGEARTVVNGQASNVAYCDISPTP